MADKLTIRFKSAREIESHWLQAEPNGGLFVPDHTKTPAGSEIELRIVFPDDAFTLKAKVIWRRATSSHSLKAGMGVAFFANQAEAVRRLQAYTQAAKLNVTLRRARRVPLAVAIRYDSLLSLARDETEDISETGIRIASKKPPPIGEGVNILLHPKGDLTPISLTGAVVWRNEASFGVSFDTLSDRTRKRLAKLVAKLSEPLEA